MNFLHCKQFLDQYKYAPHIPNADRQEQHRRSQLYFKMIQGAFVAPTALPNASVCALGTSLCRLRSSRLHYRPSVRRRSRARIIPARSALSATDVASVITEPAGVEKTLEYRLYYKSNGSTVSPWHDLPLYPDAKNKQVVSFVNEIPKGTQAKMEIATDEANTPIKQDVKKGALRFYQYGPSLVNYGAIPQTWEDPSNTVPELDAGGDGDPLDVTEIGERVMPFGAVYSVKVLGCLALLDEGEVDWKIIAINTEDPNASQINNIADVELVMPGKIDAVRDWFRLYKTAEGKGENEYGYGGEAKDVQFAMSIIDETHGSWKALQSGSIPNNDELALS